MLKAMFAFLVVAFVAVLAGPVEASENGAEAEAAALRAAVEAVVAEAVGAASGRGAAMQSGVEQNMDDATSSRELACISAQASATTTGYFECDGDYSTGECFDCSNGGDRDDPDWVCFVRWSCN